MQSHLGGALILSKYVQGMPGYDENGLDKLEDLTEKADEQFCSYLYLVNSDQGKYGTIIKGLNSQKALQNDQVHRTIIEANNVLRTHRFDYIKEPATKYNTDKYKIKTMTKKSRIIKVMKGQHCPLHS